MSVRGRKRVPRVRPAFLVCRQRAIQRCGCVRTGVRCRVGTFRLQGIPASYLIFLEKIGSAKQFTPNSRGSEKECFAFSEGYPADGRMQSSRRNPFRKIDLLANCPRNSLVLRLYQKNPQRRSAMVAISFGSLRRHRNSEKTGTFAAFSLALRA